MATKFLYNQQQYRKVIAFLSSALEMDNVDLPTLSLTLAMYCEEIGIEVYEDYNWSTRDNLIELLRIFGYSIYDNKIIKLDQ
jgi:hypothetical protein